MKKFLPFLIPLINLILGIYCQNIFPINIFILLIAIILILSTLTHSIYQNLKTSFSLNSKAHFKKNLSVTIEEGKRAKIAPLIYLLFLFSGSFLFQQKKDFNDQVLQKIANQKLQIIAKIIGIETTQNKFFNNVIKLNVLKINESVFNQSVTLLCYTKENYKLQLDDLIEIKNIKIKPLINDINKTGKPSFYDYLLKENILSTIFLNKNNEIKILKTPIFSVKRWLYKKRTEVYKILKQKFTKQTFSYFAPIFLGNKNEKNSFELKTKFNNWGITHYLARSGLHIIIFILIWSFLLQYIPIPIINKILFLVLICLVYHLFSWPSISYYRAFYIFIIYQIANFFHQQTNFLHIFSLICITILLLNPIQLFFLDFQLSFALTFSLSWLNFSIKEN